MSQSRRSDDGETGIFTVILMLVLIIGLAAWFIRDIAKSPLCKPSGVYTVIDGVETEIHECPAGDQ